MTGGGMAGELEEAGDARGHHKLHTASGDEGVVPLGRDSWRDAGLEIK